MIKLALFLFTWQAIGMAAFYIDCKVRAVKSISLWDVFKTGTAGGILAILIAFNICFENDGRWRKSPYQTFRTECGEKMSKFLLSLKPIRIVYEFFTKDRKI